MEYEHFEREPDGDLGTHLDLLDDEGFSRDEWAVMIVAGKIRRGVDKKQLLAQYEISEQYYDDNVERLTFL